MKPYNGFKAQKSAGAREILPAGGYVCRIDGAKVETYKTRNGGTMETLIWAIEVIEGEHAGFWKKDFDSQTGEDKKWRGTMRINLPKDDGSEQDSWTKRTFENAMWALEDSNPGYTWDWDEKKLKGKIVGIIYRNREWEYNGNTGWTTEAGGVTSADDIRNGKFKPLKDKPLKNKSNQNNNSSSSFSDLSDGDLPF